MIYKLLLGYFRARFFRLLIGSILSKKAPGKNLKKLTVVEYALELFNVYLMENKKNKHHPKK